MSINQAEVDKTVELLKAASTERFMKAMMSLEQQADAAEVTEIKKQVRDRIAVLRPPRRLNLMRIFCEPFEEMLRNDVAKETSWIPRSAIGICWRIVEGHMEPRLLMELKRRVEALVAPTRAQILEIGRPLWAAASKALITVTTAAHDGDESSLALFDMDEAIVGYAEVIAAACQVADAIEELQDIFPVRPFKSAGPAQREELLAELQRLSREGEYDLRCLIHVVAHWSHNPADIFDLYSSLDLGPASPIGKVLSSKREKVVVALLGERIDTLKANLTSDEINVADCAELASLAVECLDSVNDMVGLGKNPEADGTIARMRRELGTMVMDRVLVVASQTLNTIWEEGRQADVADRDSVVAAEAAARAMRKCGEVASKLGVEAAINKEITSSLAAVRSEVDEKIAHLSPGTGTKTVSNAKTTVANATRILEILEGPERAYEFYREKQNAIRSHA